MHFLTHVWRFLSAAILTNVFVKGQVDFSYKYDAGNKNFEMELTCLKPPGQDTYCAIAFAREQLMEKAEGYYCNGRQLQPFAIQIHQEPPVDIEDPNINVISATQNDGSISCKFTRPVKVTREVDFDESYEFDFMNEAFFILEAQGATTAGKMKYHDDRKSSNIKTNFSTTIEVINEDIVKEDPDDPNIGCEVVKTCFRYPDQCDLSSPSCMFISYRQIDSDFEFELRGGYGHGLEYMALAFSTDTKMEDDDLYYCTGLKLEVGVIREHGIKPVTLNSSGIVNVTSVDSNNAVGHCKFRRPACVRHMVSNNATMEFDFFKNAYYILMAKGEIEGLYENKVLKVHINQMRVCYSLDGSILYHDTNRVHTAIPLQLGNDMNRMSSYKCVPSGQDFQLRGTHSHLILTAFSLFTIFLISQ